MCKDTSKCNVHYTNILTHIKPLLHLKYILKLKCHHTHHTHGMALFAMDKRPLELVQKKKTKQTKVYVTDWVTDVVGKWVRG